MIRARVGVAGIALAGLLAIAAGCAGTSEQETPRSRADQKRIEDAIARGEVLRGMSRSEVRDAWGRPTKTRWIQLQGRKLEMWTYPSTALYFDEAGYLVRWDSPLG